MTTNLALPGFGSLMAGRKIGYPQALLGLVGLSMTTVLAAQFFTWYFANRAHLLDDQGDPMAILGEVWRAVRGPLAGMAIFFFAWVWALWTSWQLLRQAAKETPPALPPVLPR